jgi:beta-glucanase (GH16 family)
MWSIALLVALLQPTTSPTTQTSTQPAGWRLVWADEFDRDGAPDPAKWSFEHGYLRNHEAQYYTDRPQNVRVAKGSLLIEARREEIPVRDKPGELTKYTSGSIETHGKFDFTYGRLECRAKLPHGRGTWPAIWMLGSDIGRVGWPACGEIDIMENVGFEPDKLHGSIHTKTYNHVVHTEKTAVVDVPDMSTKFHVYAMEWSPETIDLFIDGRRYFRFANEHQSVDQWPFDQPAFIKLNFAVGGAWGGQKGIDDAIFPQTFEVDYVRVYQREGGTADKCR